MPPSDRAVERAQRTNAESDRVIATASIRRSDEDVSTKRKIHAYLVNELGREIVGGMHQPGSLLPSEQEMRARFSVSRTTLREVYRVLADKGLIVSRPKVGTRVRAKSDWNMLDPGVLAWQLQTVPTEDFVADLYALRRIIEPAAAALAASGQDRATIDRIAAAYADMERFKDGAGDLMAVDLQFHLAILEATGNHFIGALGGLIHAALLATFKLSWAGASRIMDDRLEQHRAIFEAIRDGLPEHARARMSDLLRNSFDDVREFLRRRDLASPGDKGPDRWSSYRESLAE